MISQLTKCQREGGLSHPALADKVTALNEATDRIRTADRDQRNSPKRRRRIDG